MKIRVFALTLCCLLGLAAEARAQVVWDSPSLIPPRAPAGTGILLIDAHRAGIGVVGTWRGTPRGTGLRLGIADGDDIAVFGGLDFVSPLTTASPAFPLDISWFAGVGAGYDRWAVLSVPFGLAIGRTFGAPDVQFTPYLAPKLIADAHLGREPQNDNELELNFDVDLGFDVRFQPGWTLRLGAGLGSRSGLAIGVVF